MCVYNVMLMLFVAINTHTHSHMHLRLSQVSRTDDDDMLVLKNIDDDNETVTKRCPVRTSRSTRCGVWNVVLEPPAGG